MEIGVGETERVVFSPAIEKNPEISAAMSMAVVSMKGYYDALYRQVSKAKPGELVPESVIAFASSPNGVDFARSGVVPLKPTQEVNSIDRIAVEDPAIVKLDGKYYVFHSAVSPKTVGEGVQVAIQVVEGDSLGHLGTDKKIVLTPKDVQDSLGEKVDMVKEPEFYFGKDGLWHMIYEHTGRGKSEIATAESPQLTGPYRNNRPLLETRENSWDSQHTSPGPLLFTSQGDILMFYNGRGPKSSEDETPSWSIGHVIIDGKTGAISNRAEAPIIRPPEEIGPGNQLISFANSITSTEGAKNNRLYYTVADTRSAVASIFVNGI
ncbi:MAG: hypothetical protein NTZ07_03595 [Candidatus Woesebacteria bacterium]|nr:hypothetical protein [Candidatus Woesebacteria bacterium]